MHPNRVSFLRCWTFVRTVLLTVFLSLGMLGLSGLSGCSEDGGNDLRLTSRASISGQVKLADIDGLNDLSRVRVDIGRGEGGTTPDDDGSFLFSDLEADVYELSITYSGSFEATADQSAYQRYTLQVVAEQGGSVNLGQIELPLGLGDIDGTVESDEGADFSGAVVRLAGVDTSLEQSLVDGAFSFPQVPVGHYSLSVDKSGLPVAGDGGTCAASVTVAHHEQKVQTASFRLANAAVSLLPGEGQVMEAVQGDWYLSGNAVTVNVENGFAKRGRAWIEGQTVPGYGDFLSDGYVFENLAEGATTVHFQFKDLCGFQSEVVSLRLLRDTTAPAIGLVQLAGGAESTKERTVSLVVTASDSLSDTMQMKTTLCNVDGETVVCEPSLAEAPWQDYAYAQSVTLPAGVGDKQVQVLLRDRSGNETAVQTATILFDDEAPQGITVTVGDGSGVIHERQIILSISGDGASWMKLGGESGLSQVAWRAFESAPIYTFGGEDGVKNLYARFKDGVGNETEEFHVQVTLNTKGTLSGSVIVENRANHGGVSLTLDGTGYQATSDEAGAFEMADVPAGNYLLTARLEGFDDVSKAITIRAAETTQAGQLSMMLSRGSLVGEAHLEGQENHSGILIQVQGQPYSTVTNDDGAFTISGVPVGNYTITATKANFAPASLTDVQVVANASVSLETITLGANPATLTGTVTLEGQTNHAGTLVTLDGTSMEAVTGEDGSFILENITAGLYTLSAMHDDFDTKTTAMFAVESGETKALATLSLSLSRGSLVGQAHLEGQENHSGILIQVQGQPYSTVTNDDGAFTMTGVKAGTYEIRATKGGYGVQSWPTVTIRANETTALEPLTLVQTPSSLSGRVLKVNETNHAQILVSVNGTPYSGTTDERGDFEITDIPAGVHSVSASADDYERFDYPLVVLGAGNHVVLEEVTLEKKKGHIRGVVELEGKSSFTGTRIELVGTSYYTNATANGEYEFIVPVGNYAGVRASYENYETAEDLAYITVTASGVATPNDLFLRCLANTVTGKVTLRNEPRHDGVLVEFLGIDGQTTQGQQISYTTENQDGSFTVSAVPVGPYRVRYSKAGDWGTISRLVTVPAGDALTLPDEELKRRYIYINEDADATTSREVELTLGSTDCDQWKVGNLPDLSDGVWEACAPGVKPWTLTGADETDVSVYAQFKDSQGINSDIVHDSIHLDTLAVIAGVTEDTLGATMSRLDTIHFTLDASGETGGTARVDIAGYATGLMLSDNGRNGDAVADDGVYELDYRITSDADVNNAVVTGRFTDAYGNVAVPVNAPGMVTIAVPPQITNLRVEPHSATGLAIVSWETNEQATGTLHWGEDEFYGNTETNPNYELQNSFEIGGGTLLPSTAYHYEITVTDLAGNSFSTGDLVFYMRPNAPDMVIALPGDDRFEVRWEAPPQENVVGYRVYRATSPNVELSGANRLVGAPTPYTHEALLVSDLSVTNDQTYYYVVTAVDEYGNESEASEEVFGTPEANNGGTEMCGGLTGERLLWTSKGSPYHVTCNIAVEAGEVLAIGPGVEVRFDAGTKLIIRGQIISLGVEGAEVVIGSSYASPQAGDWVGIEIHEGTPESKFDMETGNYYAGGIVYRTFISHAETGATMTTNIKTSPLLLQTSLTDNVIGLSGSFIIDSSVVSYNERVASCPEDTPCNMAFIRSCISNNTRGPGNEHRDAITNIIDSEVANSGNFSGHYGSIDSSIFSSSQSDAYSIDYEYLHVIRSEFSLANIKAIYGSYANSVFTNNSYIRSPMKFSGWCVLSIFHMFGSQLEDSSLYRNREDPASHVECGVSSYFLSNVIDSLSCTLDMGDGEFSYNRFSAQSGNPLILAKTITHNTFDEFSSGKGISAFAEAVISHNNFNVSPGVYTALEAGFDYGSEAEACDNWWGETWTDELDDGTSNFSAVWDYQDNVELGSIYVCDWTHSAFPEVRITSPGWGDTYPHGDIIELVGDVTDLEDGTIPSEQIVWESSQDGILGYGEQISFQPSEGFHEIWLRATDSNNQEGIAYSTLQVGGIIWTSFSFPGESWEEAATYCDQLIWEGHDNWRLPTINELRDIVRGCPATEAYGICNISTTCNEPISCYSTACEGCITGEGPNNGYYIRKDLANNGMFWSSTSSGGLKHWTLSTTSGKIESISSDTSKSIRCVRDVP